MLDVVNDCAYDQGFFDYEVEWDRRAAEALLVVRSGLDQVCGTADDHIISGVQAIDELPFVGDEALKSLRDFVLSHGCDAPEAFAIVDGVHFGFADARATLDLANSADLKTLDGLLGLPAAIAQAIIAFRPYPDTDVQEGLVQLAGIPLVGGDSLLRLRDYATTYLAIGCSDLGAVVSGIPFGPDQAHDVLDLLNASHQEDLMLFPAMGAVMSARVVIMRAANDGYTSLAQLDAIPGVSEEILTGLREGVVKLWCASDRASCGCAVEPTPASPVDAALARAADFLDDPTSAPMRRFYDLLGPASYQRMTLLVLGQLTLRFEADPPIISGAEKLDWIVLEALSEILNQKRFTFPFDWIPQTTPVPANESVARQMAVDALIVALGQAELDRSVGQTFPEIIAEQESGYLQDVVAWRTWSADGGLSLQALPKAWVFSGRLLGVTCDVTVSRITGHVLAVDLHLFL
ncbi:MAG: DNA uptake protein ComE-like DNA-binding protein [Myxococcota bacterium]|jgi:DNA uptake protein ComE-like DNA-binding protein